MMATTTIQTYDGDGNLINEETVEVPPEQTNAESIRAQMESFIDRAEQFAGTQAAWSGLTAANRSEASRQTTLATAKILRHLLNR